MEQMLTEYTAILALPNGEMARDAADRLVGANEITVTDDPNAGVWLAWTASAESDEEGISMLQEIRMRAEMSPEYLSPEAMTANGDQPTLFQSTPLVILRGYAAVVHSEEVYCV